MTAFAAHLENAIANVTLAVGPGTFPQVGFVAAGGAFSQRQNLAAINSRGVEAEARARFGPWRFDASYIYTHARDEASGLAAALNGLPPAQTPAHQASATVGFAPYANALLALTGRYAGGQSDNDLATRILTSSTTLNLVAELPVSRRIKLIFRAENLTNARIESGLSATGLITLGTPQILWAGLRVTL